MMDTDNNSEITGSQLVGRTSKQREFLQSDAASLARIELKLMVGDPKYQTSSSFSAKTMGEVAFIDKHMQYLCEHLSVNPRHYLANLKLKTKIRT